MITSSLSHQTFSWLLTQSTGVYCILFVFTQESEDRIQDTEYGKTRMAVCLSPFATGFYSFFGMSQYHQVNNFSMAILKEVRYF